LEKIKAVEKERDKFEADYTKFKERDIGRTVTTNKQLEIMKLRVEEVEKELGMARAELAGRAEQPTAAAVNPTGA
jgi:hypothetical protein